MDRRINPQKHQNHPPESDVEFPLTAAVGEAFAQAPVSAAAAQAEAALARQAVRDRLAFAALYDRYFTRVYNYVRFRCSEPEVADDLTSQVFERALAHIASFRPEKAPFGAWLFAIARNALNDHLRAQKRHPWLPLDGLRRLVTRTPSPEEAVIEAETRNELQAALSTLSERERDVIGLKFAAGLTNRQIAEMSGLSESNVGVIVYRALHRLRVSLQERGSPGEKEQQYGRP